MTNSDRTLGDHRDPYYRSYVSGFKRRDVAAGRWTDATFMQWCEEHYGDWLADAPRDGSVLELGAGDGSMLAYLQSSGFRQLDGIDISEQQARLARSLGRPVRVQDAFDALAVPAGTLGGIVALDFLEHFSKAEVTDLLCLSAAALRPGGFLLLRTPNGQGLFCGQVIYGDLTHSTIFTPNSLHQALDLAGFGDVRFREATFVRRGLRGRLRGVAWDAIRACANVVRRVQSGTAQEIWSENLLCCARAPGGTGD